MKKIYFLLFWIALLILGLAGCTETNEEQWGSFSPDITYSYDGTYYAQQKVEEVDGVSMIRVEIYRAEDDVFCFAFNPARAGDFWGICWEKDSDSLWIQSGDIGVLCYRYEQGRWEVDEGAQKPDYIVTKYEQSSSVTDE